MQEIKLTRGLVTQVDDWWFEELNQYKWFAAKDLHTYYAKRWSSTSNGKRHNICMHRVIMNTPKGMEVDHGDFNGLNNQEHNLTNCTHKKNCSHQKRRSKMYGIWFRKSTNRYEIYIVKDTIHYYGGSSTSLDKAFIIRDNFIKQLYR